MEVIVQGKVSEGKTTVLSIIEAALEKEGFTTFRTNPENPEEERISIQKGRSTNAQC